MFMIRARMPRNEWVVLRISYKPERETPPNNKNCSLSKNRLASCWNVSENGREQKCEAWAGLARGLRRRGVVCGLPGMRRGRGSWRKQSEKLQRRRKKLQRRRKKLQKLRH